MIIDFKDSHNKIQHSSPKLFPNNLNLVNCLVMIYLLETSNFSQEELDLNASARIFISSSSILL